MFAAQVVDKLLKTISAPAINLQSYNQKTRIAILKIYQQLALWPALLSNVQPYLFVSYVLQAIDGEKDPRNLLVTFDLVQHVLTLFFQETSPSLADATVDNQVLDDLFDAVARYFPINFTPPKNDTNKITAEMLQSRLRKCMLSSHKLCGHFLIFLLEKLAAKSIKTKI